MTASSKSKTLEFPDNAKAALLFGKNNENLTYLETKLDVSIADRGNKVTLTGNASIVGVAEKVLQDLWKGLQNGEAVQTADIDSKLRFMDDNKPMPSDKITIETKKKTIQPRSPNQGKYLAEIADKSMVFGLGPAGTGKTYLAVAKGVEMFLKGDVERLIFTRPAIEAGENLGFLPGDMKEKVDPYLRPIYDAMHDMMPMDFILKKMEIGDIEVAPLAFMRGRTLSNAFVILDEAQNTTCTQMKMFLTRMGESSRMVITGDISQTDLPKGIKSGLRDALEILEGVDGISFMQFEKDDVIRHPLVSRIVHAYDQHSGD